MQNNKASILPNTFLIGVQKAATTSFYNWLSQHKNICAPMSVKDLPFFARDIFYNEKGINYLSNFYSKHYKSQKIVMQGSVHYIFYEEALKRISEFNKDAKLILILRNPVERVISGYKYAVKFNYETEDLNKALEIENERINNSDFMIKSECSYLSHSLYHKQIMVLLKYFTRDQLHIVFYDEVKNNPQKALKETFNFLDIDETFEPELDVLNVTGHLKSKKLQNILFGNNNIRNFFVRKIVKKIIPEDIVDKLRWKIIHLNTKENNQTQQNGEDILIKQKILDLLIDDINKLEKYLNKDLSQWKKI